MSPIFNLSTATFIGPSEIDTEVFEMLPEEYRRLLGIANGCVLFGGGLHIRGCTAEPAWHSLRGAWIGEHSIASLYPEVLPDDIPFAQDCLGDQFLLRGGVVQRLNGEFGEVTDLGLGFDEFLAHAFNDPVEFLSLELLQRFNEEGGRLEPGQLLSVYPPLCTKEAAGGVSLRAVDALDRLGFLASFAARINGVSP